MLIRKKIKIGSIGTEIKFIVTDNIKRTCKSLSKDGHSGLKPEDSSQGVTGYDTIGDRVVFYCVVQIEQSLCNTLKTLVHELYHANQDVLEDRGVKYKKGDANEAFAYNIDYLFGETYEIVVKAWKKKYYNK